MSVAAPDIFGRATGGGKYPNMDDLEGKLVLIKPSVVEQVPKNPKFGGKPGEFVDRATADTIVFEADGTYEVFDDMYWSQAGVVPACKKALKPGAKPFVLGRVAKVPSKIGKDQGFDTTEKITAGLAEWLKKGGKGDKPNYAWGLTDFTDADIAMAMKYISDTSPLASASAE